MEEPRREDPSEPSSSSNTKHAQPPQGSPQRPRRTAEKLPPPILVAVFFLFVLYLAVFGFQPSKDRVKVVINTLKPSTATSTVTVQVPLPPPSSLHITSTASSTITASTSIPLLVQDNNSAMAATEQTYVPLPQPPDFANENWCYSFIAIKPDGVMVCALFNQLLRNGQSDMWRSVVLSAPSSPASRTAG
jgi:hypothetical protein